MTTNQILHKLEALEERMGAPDLPRPEFVISFVESADGYPTGRVTRVRYGDSGQIISQEEVFIDPAILRHRHGSGELT
jgi:hypothetical protein